MLRHTFVTTMLDAGVDLRDVQIAARHADPRTTMRYDNPRGLYQPGEKPQVSRSWQGRDSVRCLRTAAV
jgi:integrase